MAPLTGVRVIDDAHDIAGPYCTKLLAEQGATVVRLRAADDPLRAERSGGLFEFVNGGKLVAEGDPSGRARLVGGADIYVTDGPIDLDELAAANPGLVVVTITPFGLDGPWAERPATEFTLQAACGSSGNRGLPDRPPVAAGGRLGEWVSGVYGAFGGMAALRGGSTGLRHVDIAMLDVMSVAMTIFPTVFAEMLGWPPVEPPVRTIEVPSVEPAADGFIGFTTNSGQQFADLLVMLEQTDLDPAMSRPAERWKRREEFWKILREFTTARTVAELLDLAGLLRIPSAPVLDASGLLAFPHFIERGLFERSASGAFVAPRHPIHVGDHAPVPSAVAEPGSVEWPPRETAPRAASASSLPLDGLRVVDLTAWWAGPAASHALATMGADVVKIESPTRGDQMRFASTRAPGSDQWWEWGPIFHGVNTNKRGITLDIGDSRGAELLERLLADADVVIENFTPRVMEQHGFTWDRLHALNERLVMVRMPAFGLDGPWRDRTGFAQTMEMITGMASRTGYPDGDPTLVRGVCDPAAGMMAAFATLCALQFRERTGLGTLVEVPLVEVSLHLAAELVIEYSATGVAPGREGNRSQLAAPQGVYPCAGVDAWVAVAVVTDEQWLALARLIGADASALPTASARRRAHGEIDALIAAWTSARGPVDAADELAAAGVPAAAVVAPREITDNPQLRHRAQFALEPHIVAGEHEVPVLPIRVVGVDRLRRPSPAIGQHDAEVYGELGVTGDELAALTDAGVIGPRLR